MLKPFALINIINYLPTLLSGWTSSLSSLIVVSSHSDLKVPDFNHDLPPRIISAEELGLDLPHRRVIYMGDIHGMNHSLHSLLHKLHYTPKLDTLIPTGDLTTKGDEAGTLAVLSFLSENDVPAVRGNHDQAIIRWRAWQDWIDSLPSVHVRAEDGQLRRMSGAQWLNDLDHSWRTRREKRRDKWIKHQRKKGPKEWWRRVPKEWRSAMFSEHYTLARAITPAQSAYLRSLPSIIHIPSLHTFVMHAGMVPYNPKKSSSAASQPLSRIPKENKASAMRLEQESALLRNIPQNRDPWTPLFLRAVSRSGDLSKDARLGKYWARIWTETLDRCTGFNAQHAAAEHGKLPCMPATTVYGHSAEFGLDVRRWSLGLDSGCVYGRKLTALVITNHSLTTPPSRQPLTVLQEAVNDNDYQAGLSRTVVAPEWVSYGDEGSAHVVQVRCQQDMH